VVLARRVRGTGNPVTETFAAINVLDPPAESEILERFAEVESKT